MGHGNRVKGVLKRNTVDKRAVIVWDKCQKVSELGSPHVWRAPVEKWRFDYYWLKQMRAHFVCDTYIEKGRFHVVTMLQEKRSFCVGGIDH